MFQGPKLLHQSTNGFKNFGTGQSHNAEKYSTRQNFAECSGFRVISKKLPSDPMFYF